MKPNLSLYTPVPNEYGDHDHVLVGPQGQTIRHCRYISDMLEEMQELNVTCCRVVTPHRVVDVAFEHPTVATEPPKWPRLTRPS